MADKKRKSTSSEGERPSKKQQTATSVRVSHVSGSDIVKPVIASSPGVTFPSDIKFQSFVKKGSSSLLLQSSEHPTINYTANEGDKSIDSHLKHYVAVFDHQTGKLQVTEAKRLTVRSAIRAAIPSRDSDDEVENVPVSNYTSRAALTQAFGTKKSKKAVQSIAENRLLAQGNADADNPVSAAMLADVNDEDEISEQLSQAEALRNKPLPPANLTTNEIDQVYPPSSLVQPSPASTTLSAMPTGPWLARLSAKKEIKTRSHFVASRVGYLGKHIIDSSSSNPKLTQALQILRYIQLLLELHTYLAKMPRKRAIPPVDKWPDNTFSEGTPMNLIKPIVQHFLPDRLRTTHAIALLRTTILALTLHIPPPTLKPGVGLLITEPTDVSLDMAIEAAEVRKLYRELGCRVEAAKDNELERWGMERLGKKRKDEKGNTSPKPVFARLKLPLVFPKVSRGRPSGRR